MSLQFWDDELTTYWLCKFLARNVKNLVSAFQRANLHLCFLHPSYKIFLLYIELDTLRQRTDRSEIQFHSLDRHVILWFLFLSFLDLYFWLTVFPMVFWTMIDYILWPQNYTIFNKSKYKPPGHVFCSVASLEKITWRLYATKTKRTERGIKQSDNKI